MQAFIPFLNMLDGIPKVMGNALCLWSTLLSPFAFYPFTCLLDFFCSFACHNGNGRASYVHVYLPQSVLSASLTWYPSSFHLSFNENHFHGLQSTPSTAIGPSSIHSNGRIPFSGKGLRLPNMILSGSPPFTFTCRSHSLCTQYPMIFQAYCVIAVKAHAFLPSTWMYKRSMDGPRPWLQVLERVFLLSSSVSIFDALAAVPPFAFIYLAFIFAYAIGCFRLRPPDPPIMFQSPLSIFNLFFFLTLLLSRISNAQNVMSTTISLAGTPTTFRPEFTVPSSADVGMYICWEQYSCFGLLHALRDMFWEQKTLNNPSSCLIASAFALKKGC